MATRSLLSLGSDQGHDALDLVSRNPASSIVPPEPTGKADPLAELRERYALGDFSGALHAVAGRTPTTNSGDQRASAIQPAARFAVLSIFMDLELLPFLEYHRE